MDIILGSVVVLIGAAAIAVACMAIWGTIRALIAGNFVVAALLIAGMVAAGYYGRQGYTELNRRFAPTDLTVDLRSGERIVPAEWSTDLRRLTGQRSVKVITPDNRQYQMTAQVVELRKTGDTLDSVWMSSNPLTSDDAADLAKTIAEELQMNTDDLPAWADHHRHGFERDPHGWNAEHASRPYVKITIDSEGHGFWWVGVMYAR